MREILTNALVEIVLAVLVVLGGAAVALIKAKISQINAASTNDTENKIRWEVADAIEDAVIAVNQTFVNELKADKLFDEEMQ
jgi:cell division protein FtsN